MRALGVLFSAFGVIYLGAIGDSVGAWACVICLTVWASGHD